MFGMQPRRDPSRLELAISILVTLAVLGLAAHHVVTLLLAGAYLQLAADMLPVAIILVTSYFFIRL